VLATLDVHQQATAAMKPDWAGLSGMDWRAIHSWRLRERLERGAACKMAVVEAFQLVLTEWLISHLQAKLPSGARTADGLKARYTPAFVSDAGAGVGRDRLGGAVIVPSQSCLVS
jgi:hypothetical protein